MLARCWRWPPAIAWDGWWTAPARSPESWLELSLGREIIRRWTAQLELLQVRAQMLLRALRLFYAALGLFASAALISVGGSLAAYYGQSLLVMAAGLAMTTGAAAVVCLAWGCARMVQETRLAVRNLAEEARLGMKTQHPRKIG